MTSGTPSQELIALVAPLRTTQGVLLLKPIIQKGYTSPIPQHPWQLTKYDSRAIRLSRFRQEYGVAGSTVDKVALFFTAACNAAGIPLSPLLST